MPESELEETLRGLEIRSCESACESDFAIAAHSWELSSRTDKAKRKYMKYDKDGPAFVRWEKLHGKKRKAVKYDIRKTTRRIIQTFKAFNKYCGRDDVLYIHARIGGWNWSHFGGPELEKQPWFLERCDDSYDSTYCDIYAKIDPATAKDATEQILRDYGQNDQKEDA